MKIDDFKRIGDELTRDQRPELYSRLELSIEKWIRYYGEEFRHIVGPLLDDLFPKFKAAFENGGRLHDLLPHFDHQLSDALRSEIERNRLPTPGEMVGRVGRDLDRSGWNTAEKGLLEQILESGERILKISVHSITTSKRTLVRSDLNAVRPVTWRNDDSWFGQFTSPKKLEEFEERERDLARVDKE
jgi:hypothetical protein